MTEWQVAGSPERYETEGQALAAAWAITPPGGHRPDVVRAPPSDLSWLDMRQLSITPNYEEVAWDDSYKDRVYTSNTSITISAVVTCPLGVSWEDGKRAALQSLAKIAKVRRMVLVPGSESFNLRIRISGGAVPINDIAVEVVARVP